MPSPPSDAPTAAPPPPRSDSSTAEASDEAPAVVPGLDMQLQWGTVYARLVGHAPDDHRIGRYRVQGTLGQGGMGKVLRVRDETLGREVALKVLHDHGGDRQAERLVREAQALARLAHPHVVRVYDVAEIDGRVCMAMELVEGVPLHEWQRTPRPWGEVLGVYLQAGRGLAAAHAEGLVHRDFKPSNCILDTQGVVKVLDFGLARGVGGATGPHPAVELDRTAESERVSGFSRDRLSSWSHRTHEPLTRTGTVLGTLAYMAPEQLRGSVADPKCDQFAFCVALYEALHGVRPFPGKNARELLDASRTLPLDPLPARPGLPTVPRWLHEAVRRGLAAASQERWPEMSALLGTLERGLARRRRIRNGVLGAVAVLGLAGAVSGALPRDEPCEGLAAQGMPGWAATERATVGAALGAVALPDAAAIRDAVWAGLDAYAETWTASRVDACEATFVRHTVAEQGMLHRLECLDDRTARAHAVVEQLASADARTAAHASEAVASLPDPRACDDVEALLRGPAPVPDALVDAAARVRELVARSWALGATGDGEHGLAAADAAVAAAAALTDVPTLELDARRDRGHLLRMARRWAEARTELEAALELAERLEDSARAIDVLAELVLLAEDEEDVSAASAWLGAIRGKLRRHEHEPRRVAERWWLEGLVALAGGRGDAALADARRAVEAYDRLDPPVERQRIEAYLLLGDALEDHGEPEEARAAYERALTIAETGALLPMVPHVLYRLARHYYLQGQLEPALPLLERALALRDSFYGPRAAASIRTRLLLAVIHYFQGQLPLALEQVSLAREALDERVPAHLRGEVHQLAAALHRARAEWDEAIASYRSAELAWQSVPAPNRVDLALIDGDIADCFAAKGELDTARPLYDAAISVIDAVAPDDPRRAQPQLGRGKLLLALGQPTAAARDLRAAHALRDALPPDPARDAELAWALGRALRPDATVGTQLTREATRLVREAREAFVALEQGERVREIERWLERCGPPCAATHDEPNASPPP